MNHKNSIISTLFLLQTTLFITGSLNALEVATTSSVYGLPNRNAATAELRYNTILTITNDSPALANFPIEWYVDWGAESCLPLYTSVLNFCCVFMGNEAQDFRQSVGESCPLGAMTSTFAFVASAHDSSSSSCINPCFNDEPRSPLMISFDDQHYNLTSLEEGVRFDLDQDGYNERVSWTASQAAEGFLALDVNGNGRIDNGMELFGDATFPGSEDRSNGFEALAFYDTVEEGGNGDGSMTAEDEIFSSLLIWFDLNHDGFSQSVELHTLESLAVEKLELDYRQSSRRDRHGNEFRYHAQALVDGRSAPIWDVFLLRE